MISDNSSFIPEHWFVPTNYKVDSKKFHVYREYKLNIWQKIFVLIERPKSCKLALLISTFINSCIIVGTICYVLANDPEFWHQEHECDHHYIACDPHNYDAQAYANSTLAGGNLYMHYCPHHIVCMPHPYDYLHKIEDYILFIFTAEYGLRVLTLWSIPDRLANLISDDHDKHEDEMHLQDPDPALAPFTKYLHYITEWKNVIDIATIVPFYLVVEGVGHAASYNFIRILRLSRILHVFKLTKDNEVLHILENTVRLSAPGLALWFFISALGMCLLGSIVYFCEGGTFYATEYEPDGAYYRKNLYGNDMELTPFTSIAASMYWVISTATNTGYSDLVPTSVGGRAVACVTMLLGVITCAIPISVIGANFSHEYEEMHKRHKKRLKQIERAQHWKSAVADHGGMHSLVRKFKETTTNASESTSSATNAHDKATINNDLHKANAVALESIQKELNRLTSLVEKMAKSQ